MCTLLWVILLSAASSSTLALSLLPTAPLLHGRGGGGGGGLSEQRRSPANRSLILIKVPKTGGSTLAGVIRRIGARRGYSHVQDAEWLERDPRGRSAAVWANHGKRWKLQRQFERRLPGALYIASFRSPADRCLSGFYDWLVKRRRIKVSTAKGKISYLAACPPDYQARYAQEREGQGPAEVVSSYDAVIATERFDESLIVAREKLNASLVDMLYVKAKALPATLDRSRAHVPLGEEASELQEAVRRKWNGSVDEELLRLVNGRLDQELAALGPRAKAELAQFRQMLARVAEVCYRPWRKRDCLWKDNGCEQVCIDDVAASEGWE